MMHMDGVSWTFQSNIAVHLYNIKIIIQPRFTLEVIVTILVHINAVFDLRHTGHFYQICPTK